MSMMMLEGSRNSFEFDLTRKYDGREATAVLYRRCPRVQRPPGGGAKAGHADLDLSLHLIGSALTNPCMISYPVPLLSVLQHHCPGLDRPVSVHLVTW